MRSGYRRPSDAPVYTDQVIFRRVNDGRPYPDHGLAQRDWAEISPTQVRLGDLTTTKTSSTSSTSSTRTPPTSATCSRTSSAGTASSSWRTVCTARSAPRCSNAACCTPASTRSATTHEPDPSGRDGRRVGRRLRGRAVRRLQAAHRERRHLRRGADLREPHRRRGRQAHQQPRDGQRLQRQPARRPGQPRQHQPAAPRVPGRHGGQQHQRGQARGVTILTNDRDDPRVKLVAQQFDNVEFTEPDIDVEDGVTVIVGDDYKDLVKTLRATSSPTGRSRCASPRSTCPDRAIASVVSPAGQAAMASDVTQPLLGLLAYRSGGDDQQVVALLQPCGAVRHERLARRARPA